MKFTCRKYARENLLVSPPGLCIEIWSEISFVFDGICWLIMKEVMCILLNHPLAKTSLKNTWYKDKFKMFFYALIKRSRDIISVFWNRVQDCRKSADSWREERGNRSSSLKIRYKLRWRHIYLSWGRVQKIRCILYPLPGLLHTVFHLILLWVRGRGWEVGGWEAVWKG